MKKYILTIFIVAAVVMTGCKSENNKNNHDGHDHEQHEGADHEENDEHSADEKHEDEIAFSKAQAVAANLRIETVQAGTFSQVIKTSGQILAAQGDEAVVASTINGIVSFAGTALTEGSAIRQGQTMVLVSAKKLSDGDPANKARVEFDVAERDFRRASELVKDNIISAKEYEQKLSRYQLAKAAYEAVGSGNTAGGVKLTSPIDGFIKQLRVKQGDYVSVGQPIAVVSQNRRLQLRAEVSEKYFRDLNGIFSANFRTTYDNTVYELSRLNGRLLSYGKTTGGDSFYLPVTFEFDNKGNIAPGSFVEVYLLASPRNNVISVPATAITEEQGLYFTYIQLDEEGYRKQEVITGGNNGKRVEIKSGLKPGDKVVTQGVYQVKLAASSSVIPEGHSH